MKLKPISLITSCALTVTILLGLSSCFNLNCIDGNNQVITQQRTIPGSFDEISLAADFTVFIKPGSSEEKIVVDAESNLMPYIITDIKGNRLVLRTPNNTCIDPHESVIITIFTNKKFHKLDISGSGYMQCDSLNVNDLSLNISGSGDIKLPLYVNTLDANISGSGDIEVWGEAKNSKLNISGSGNIRAINLIQNHCKAVISGSGNIYVYVINDLDVTISGSGSVYYKGNPLIEAHISGSGSVKPV